MGRRKKKERQRTKEVSSEEATTTPSPVKAGAEEGGKDSEITPRRKRGRPRKVVVDRESEDKERVLEGDDKLVVGEIKNKKKKKARGEDDQQETKQDEKDADVKEVEESSSRMITRSRARRKSTPRKSS